MNRNFTDYLSLWPAVVLPAGPIALISAMVYSSAVTERALVMMFEMARISMFGTPPVAPLPPFPTDLVRDQIHEVTAASRIDNTANALVLTPDQMSALMTVKPQ